jgi:hypothetical protein
MPMYDIHIAKEGKTFDPRPAELPDTKSAKHHARRVAGGVSALSSRFGMTWARCTNAAVGPGQSDPQHLARR